MRPEFRYEALDVDVVDPTTVVATIDLGFRHTVTVPLTLVGIDPVEPGTEEERHAKRHLAARVSNAEHLWVSTVEDPDVPGRYSAVLYADDRNLNMDLVKSGLVTFYDGGGRIE